MTVETSMLVRELCQDRNLGVINSKRQKVIRKVGTEYMKTDTALRTLSTLLEDFGKANNGQEDVNVRYQNFTNFVLKEAELSIVHKPKKWKNIKAKPYWDKTLSAKWKQMHEAELRFRKARKNQSSNVLFLRNCFKRKQRDFDKVLCKKKCAYHKSLLLKIESCNNRDPKAFWNFVKNLGPRKRTEIPWKVCIDGVITTDKEKVLTKWKDDFENLYNVSDTNFDQKFNKEAIWLYAELFLGHHDGSCHGLW